jgi:hypothetical protein
MELSVRGPEFFHTGLDISAVFCENNLDEIYCELTEDDIQRTKVHPETAGRGSKDG